MAGNSDRVSLQGGGSGSEYQIGDGVSLSAGHLFINFSFPGASTYISSVNVQLDYRNYLQNFNNTVAAFYTGPGALSLPRNRPGDLQGFAGIVENDTILISNRGNVDSSDDGLVLFLDAQDLINNVNTLDSSSSIFREAFPGGSGRTTTTGTIIGLTPTLSNPASVGVALPGVLQFSGVSQPGESGGAYLLRFEGQDFVIGTHFGNQSVNVGGIAAPINAVGTFFSAAEFAQINDFLSNNQAGDVTDTEPTNLIVGSTQADGTIVGSFRADIILGRDGSETLNDGDGLLGQQSTFADDQLFGGAGNDQFNVALGNDLLHGGDHRVLKGAPSRVQLNEDGIDSVDYSVIVDQGVTITFGQNNDADNTHGATADFANAIFVRENGALGSVDTLISIEKLTASSLDDAFVFTSLDPTLLAAESGQGGLVTIDLGGNQDGGDIVDFAQSTQSINFNLETGRLELRDDEAVGLTVLNSESVLAGSGFDTLNIGSVSVFQVNTDDDGNYVIESSDPMVNGFRFNGFETVAANPDKDATADFTQLGELDLLELPAVSGPPLAAAFRSSPITTVVPNSLSAINLTGFSRFILSAEDDDAVLSNSEGLVVFGGAGGDDITTGSGDDDLYGNNEANDEDNAGDFLKGGDGDDDYFVGDGDVISDSDGKGSVRLGNLTLSGGTAEGEEDEHTVVDGREYTGSGGETYQFSGGDLVVTTSSGAEIVIEGWNQDDLGITLTNEGDDDDNPPDNQGSPLVLDLDGDGIELTSLVDDPVFFDIDNDGIRERTAFVAPDDGLLALDRNGDGVINDANELFGSGTQFVHRRRAKIQVT